MRRLVPIFFVFLAFTFPCMQKGHAQTTFNASASFSGSVSTDAGDGFVTIDWETAPVFSTNDIGAASSTISGSGVVSNQSLAIGELFGFSAGANGNAFNGNTSGTSTSVGTLVITNNGPDAIITIDAGVNLLAQTSGASSLTNDANAQSFFSATDVFGNEIFGFNAQSLLSSGDGLVAVNEELSFDFPLINSDVLVLNFVVDTTGEATAAIPEPGSTVFASLVSLALLARRRR